MNEKQIEKPAVKTRWFTFGQSHVHSYGSRTLDKDYVVKITGPDPRGFMIALFGQKWAMEYAQQPDMEYFPKGVIEL